MEAVGKIKNGRIMLAPLVAAEKESYLRSLSDGTNVLVKIERVKGKKRTAAQLRCHFGLVVGTILKTFEERGWDMATVFPFPSLPDGLPVPVDVLQQILYAVAGDVGDNGERKTLSQMSPVEASRFFEKCRDFAASRWKIAIPDPVTQWRDNG